jgi:hypothetical protein
MAFEHQSILLIVSYPNGIETIGYYCIQVCEGIVVILPDFIELTFLFAAAINHENHVTIKQVETGFVNIIRCWHLYCCSTVLIVITDFTIITTTVVNI